MTNQDIKNHIKENQNNPSQGVSEAQIAKHFGVSNKIIHDRLVEISQIERDLEDRKGLLNCWVNQDTTVSLSKALKGPLFYFINN